ncbi:tape measure protein [Mycobacterium phage Bananafish]|uniref:Tape measure protein n=1 Tax=Mycobacterium phage Bananafish TaxID=2572532 RepID=A0A4D6T6E8_9CAUD|nr:tape measure protein [Mycobacterium phage Bananafish]
MTTAGSINLGVDIDASDLRGELTRAVQEAMGPVLADLNRDMRDSQRQAQSGYRDTARAANDSANQQRLAAQRVQRGIHGITEEHRKATAAATAFGLAQVASLRDGTRAINAQARAWDRLAAAKARAAAVPNPDAPRGPPPGTGGGGGGGRAGGGRAGGVGGFLTSPLGLNAIAVGAAAIPPALQAGSLAAANLLGAIQQLTQAGLALPGVFAGIATSVGTAVFGFKGLGEAVTALWEAAASGDPKDLEKAAEALKDMAPAAQDVAKAVAGTRDRFVDLRKEVQQNMFEGVAGDFTTLVDRQFPAVQAGLAKTSKAWNSTIRELLRVGASDKVTGFLDRIFGNTAEGQKRANAAIEPLINGLGRLAAVGSDFLPRLGDGLAKLANRFDAFITKAEQSGDLAKWIDEGFRAAANFGESLLNIGKILTDITKAAGGDGGFLKWLRDATTQLHEFLSSDEGQEKLTNFFNEGRQAIAEWKPILQDLISVARQVFDGFRQWGEFMLPVLRTVADLLASMPDSVTAVVTAFLAWKTLTGVTSLLTNLGGIGRGLDSLPGRANTAAGGITRALNKIAVPALLAPLLTGYTDGLVGPDQSVASNLGGGALNIAGGALLGAQFGPWGAALGAMIGAGVTLFQSTKERLDKAKAEWEAQWEEDHNAGPDRPGSAEQQLAAFPELRGTRLPSLYNPDGSLKPSPGQQFADVIGSGKVPGAVINPDGTVTYNGVTIPNFKVPQPGTPTQQPYPLRTAPVQGPQAVPPPKMPVPAVPDIAPSDLGGLLGAKEEVRQLATEITELPEGEVRIKDPSPELLENLNKVDATITKVGENEIQVKADTKKAQAEVDAFVLKYKQQQIQLQISALPPGAVPQGRAFGGAIYGGVPGRDSVPAMLMPGEHVLTTADVARMGGQANVYAFRRALHFADGGEVPGLPTIPGVSDDNTELGVLRQIRDLLAGKTGTGPLVDTAKAVGNIAQDTTQGGSGSATGPFGTPIKPRHRGYEMAAAAISALGGDPEKFLGADPATLPVSQGGILPNLAALSAGAAGGGIDVAQLQKFARTGNVADLPAGMSLNDPVVTAITSARNKKKGMGADAISDLVGQALAPGGFTGTLDANNTALVKALEKLRTKGLPATPGSGGSSALAAYGGLPGGLGGGLMDPVSAYAAAHSGGQYQWGASDLAAGLSDCSGAISDLVELITKGQATGERLFSTADAGSVLKSLGAVEGALPGALQIGWDAGHMRATLPNGVPFESGGGTGQGATYGGNARGAAGMPNIMSLPVNGVYGAIPGLASGSTGGTPVFVTNWPGGGQNGIGGQMLGGLFNGLGQAGQNVSGDLLSGISALSPNIGNKVPNAELAKLVREGNPLALLAAAGFNVPDFTKQGGQGGEFEANTSAYDSSGRLISNTSALSDRTSTSLAAQIEDMKKQLVSVVDQVSDKLSEDALKPIMESAIQAGLEGLKDSVTSAIGTQLGQAAGPPIADAVRSAIPSGNGTGNVGGDLANAATGALAAGFAAGGPVYGGTPGRDSVPAMLMPGEHVLTTADVSRLGGQAGVYAFRRALARGGVRGFATGGGVIANDTVGAEFFGVSEVPILGAIVNLLVRVLLKVLGVEIEARDTLMEMTDDFRQFRGDFKAFDATGRLMNDTSALVDRSSTSEQEAAQERIRILKIVIEALIKYIIEKVIVPIAKAVANAAIQAGASAAGAAINSQAPGAGGIVSSLISSAGSAGVDIAAEIGTDFALAVAGTLIDVLGDSITSYGGDLATAIFGGGAIQSLLIGPLTAITDPILSAFGTVTGLISTLFGGLLGAASFDDGGIAVGTGMMPKATIAPERVLNPTQTQLFGRMVAALERGATPTGGDKRIEVHAPITVNGGPEAGKDVRSRLLELID